MDPYEPRNIEQFNKLLQTRGYKNSYTIDCSSQFWSDVVRVGVWDFSWIILKNCKIPHMRDFLTLTLEKLTKLDISNSPPYGKNLIGNNGIKLLCKTKFLVLQILQIDQCGVSAEGLKHLIKSQWPNLKFLVMDCGIKKYKKIKVTGWQVISYHNWIKLEQLDISLTGSIGLLNMVLMKVQKDKTFSVYQYDLRSQQMLKSISSLLSDRTFALKVNIL